MEERRKKKINITSTQIQKKITTRETKIQEFGFDLSTTKCLNKKPNTAIYRTRREVNAK